ncbi:MAG: response regulator transcription factor [Anaerolineae bacterium]
MQQILVIEDEADVRSMLRLMLIEHGFSVLTASDALTGLRLAYQHRPDAIILDVMMPGMDGFEACRRLREMTDTPILLLTGQRTSTEDIVKGLALGADEYMTKPFKMSELMGRLRVCLRRSSACSDHGSQYLFPAPGVVLDCGRHELTIQGRVVSLSPSEFEVFQVLVRHAGHILSHNAILAQAWGPERIGDGDLIKQYIYQLRQKIEPDPTEPRYIHTVRGEGYYFEGTEP